MVDLLNEKQFRKMKSYNEVTRSRVPCHKFPLCLPPTKVSLFKRNR